MSIENLRDILCKTTAQDMSSFQKQPSRDALRKSCSKNMQQIYRRTPMTKFDFNKVCNFIEITLRHGCFPVNLLHIFRKLYKYTYVGLPLDMESQLLRNRH